MEGRILNCRQCYRLKRMDIEGKYILGLTDLQLSILFQGFLSWPSFLLAPCDSVSHKILDEVLKKYLWRDLSIEECLFKNTNTPSTLLKCASIYARIGWYATAVCQERENSCIFCISYSLMVFLFDRRWPA